MDAPLTVPLDFPCERCGYNLRGLERSSACPECGWPVESTLWSHSLNLRRPRFSQVREIRRIWAKELAARCGFSSDAAEFILPIVRRRNREKVARSPRSIDRDGIGARDVCDALRDHMITSREGRDEILVHLDAMGIHSSEDVGKLVDALCDAGLLKRGPNDSPESFAGIFTRETFFTF